LEISAINNLAQLDGLVFDTVRFQYHDPISDIIPGLQLGKKAFELHALQDCLIFLSIEN